MNNEPSQQRRTGFALLLGFLPTAFVLAIVGFAPESLSLDWRDAAFRRMSLLVCSVSLTSSFASALFLLRQKKGAPLVIGILLLVLNAAIAFLFGLATLVGPG